MRITALRSLRLGIALLASLHAILAFAQAPSLEALEKAVAQSPESAKAHFDLANAYANEVKANGMLSAATYAPKVKEEFEKTVALDPKHIEARFGLVQIYAIAPGIMGGSYEKAFEQAAAIKALDPIVGHRAYAFIYTQQKKPEVAKQEYLDAIREQPKSAKARSFYGQYLVNSEKNYTAAFAEFDRALEIDPAYMVALYHLGRTAALAKTQAARGEEALKKYLAYTPKLSEPTLAHAHYFLGAIYEAQGKKAEARQSYETALRLDATIKDASEALKRVS